jgi:hypothetical protein
MKWKKLGKIFDPTTHILTNNCHEFAQSPQALVFDNFIRIYFSTREKDNSGKYLSHISFVDMDRSFKKIIAVSTIPVIELGSLGCYDEHGIFPLNILKDDNRILGYISGWSRKLSVPVDTSIGLAISHNGGVTFERIGEGPILTSSLREPFLVGDPFVLKVNDIYHMWYIYGLRWLVNPVSNIHERVYKIGHAISSDGVSWEKEGRQLIEDKLNTDECQALPTVVDLDGKYLMYFCYRQAIDFRKNSNNSYRLGYAYSYDLQNWIRDDDNAGIDVSKDSWDSDMMCYPHLVKCDGKLFMLYNGNEFGRFGFGAAVLEN